MKNHSSSSNAGIFSPRALVAVALASIGLSLGWLSFAATPSSGTVSVANPSVSYTGSGPYILPSAGGDTCAAPDQCDEFALTVNLPADYSTTHPNDKIRCEIRWDDPTGGADFDLYVHDSNGNQIGGTSGATSSNPEAVEFAATGGTHTYTMRVKPYLPAGLNYTGKASLVAAVGGPSATPAPFTGIKPRYLNYAPGPGIGENAGEPTIGFHPATKHAMYIAGLQTLRVTFPAAGSCAALWEDVSAIFTSKKSLDPILFTDQTTGRTFVSQLNSVVPPASPVLIGLNSLMAYTDDDGQTWVPAQLNPPDGSYDHQSVGAGPYPPTLAPIFSNPANKGHAVYYCSQGGVTAFCSRSDDGGLNFGPSRAIYNSVTDGCGGIHGHVKVAPDGTVYVPNRGCNGVQALAVSEDGGITWQIRKVQGQGWTAQPPPGILDPSVGIASDGTLYFSWVSGQNDGGHAMAAVSHDKGLTWILPTDIGAAQNIHNAVFVSAVAGDPQRASVGYVGTETPGDHQDTNFKGNWFAYIATTYDGGQTWAVVNATPNDPVQREACIWNQGGSNACRNLLDFNDITIDDRGRALYSYADGCIGDCVSRPPNSYSAKATIARQSGGRGLLATFDPQEPKIPDSACLTGRRDDLASYLTWVAPDNGGADIQSYKILRGTTANNLVQIGTGIGTKTTYTDRSLDAAVATYYYQVIARNAQGDGAASNIVPLTTTPRFEPTGACVLPGVQIVVDPIGDASDSLPQHDITSVSLSEPDALPGKLVFTMKVVNLAAPVPPNFRYAVRFGAPTPPPPDPVLGAQEDYFVSYVSGAEQFTYGTTGVPQNAPGRVFTTLGNLDPASHVDPDGTITLILLKPAISNPTPGQAITSVFGSVRLNGPTGGTNETIPDSTGTGSYALRSTTLCLPNNAPLARLAANVESGYKPLPVHFDASQSSDPDQIDTIASYTFNFGDGTDDVVQNCSSNPQCSMIDHTFTEAGLFAVKCVVTDSRGKTSANTAQALIEVDVPFLNVASRRGHNGNPFDIDLPLSGSPAVECRLPGPAQSYQLIYTFVRNISVLGTATSAQGNATVFEPVAGPLANQVTVNVANVSDQQHLVIILNGVQDSAGAVMNNIPGRVDILVGDVNGDGTVNAADATIARNRSGQLTDVNNFRADVNFDGTVNAADATVVRNASGHAVLGAPTAGSGAARKQDSQ
ncbi:MAG: PKD domain-containing protein [Verrucomicrobiota bacterium]|nr:PKD domain-containing protein [Verrucomicrobiota bacterium]